MQVMGIERNRPAGRVTSKPSTRPAVLYLINQYPAISHTFIKREILALERLGVRTSYALQREPAKHWWIRAILKSSRVRRICFNGRSACYRT